jgi:hypothetical protein
MVPKTTGPSRRGQGGVLVVVNGELTLLVNGGMDLAVLAVVERLGRLPHRGPLRKALAVGVGTAPTLVTLLWPGLPLTGAWAALTPVALAGAAWAPMRRSEWVRAVGWTYAATVTLGGAVMALTGVGVPPWLALMAVPLLAWGASAWWRREVARPWAARAGRAPVRVRDHGRWLELTALWDTGNRVLDPVSAKPVMVVDFDSVRPLLPPGRVAAVERCLSGQTVPGVRCVQAVTPAGPVRLPLWDVEHAEVEVDGRWEALVPLTLGLTNHWQGAQRDFQALLNPAWVARSRSRYA